MNSRCSSMWGLLKLKEKHSEKAECYTCSSAGALVLWRYILLVDKRSRLFSVVAGAPRKQFQSVPVLEVNVG